MYILKQYYLFSSQVGINLNLGEGGEVILHPVGFPLITQRR